MHLWWPSSEEEVDFLFERTTIDGNKMQVGYQYFSRDGGLVYADGSFGLAYHDEVAGLGNVPEKTFLIDKERCLTFDLERGTRRSYWSPKSTESLPLERYFDSSSVVL